MGFRLIRLRLRRKLRLSEQKAKNISENTEQGVEKYLFKRIGKLRQIKRFVFSWIILILIAIIATIGQNSLLSGYYQTLRPVPGGIYNEGVIGTFTTANPIYAVNNVDTTVSHLLFASLFKYNSSNQLVGELASSYSVNSRGNVYTVHLKPNLRWQDGYPLTSKDVVYTYNLIENPNAQSPLFNSWQNVKVKTDGPLTITFTLPSALASFPYDMTNGILPEHLLQNVPADEMRSAPFNTTNPIGSGPFQWQTISVSGNDPSNAEEQITMIPFNRYVLGKPKLQAFIVHSYANKSRLINAFEAGQLNGAEGLNQIPPKIAKMPNLDVHNLIMTAGVYVFFKTSSGILANQTIRSALIQAVNIPSIISTLGYPTHQVNEPLLEGQLGYNPAFKEPSYNLTAAKNLLTQAGWIPGPNGIRINKGQLLQFNLTISNSSEYLKVAKQLRRYWAILGAKVNLIIEDPSDFSNILQNHIYEAVLYGISIGVDPDVYVYWDGSQAQANSIDQLNLSEWNNPNANVSLEEGRTNLNPSIRVAKYRHLLESWQHDLPALGLYQPRSLYLTNGPVFGLNSSVINSSSGRLNNVQNWEINEADVTN